MKNKKLSASRAVKPEAVILPLGLGTALSLMGDATLYTVLPNHTREAGITLAAVGLMLGVNRVVRLFFNGVAGKANDRWARRPLFIGSLFLGTFSTALYAAVPGFWPLLAGRILWGLAWSGIWVGGTTILLDVTHSGDRGKYIGLYQTWFFLGAAAGALAGGVLTDRIGYTNTMWIGSLVTLSGAVSAILLLPETRLVSETSPLEEVLQNRAVSPLSGKRRPRFGVKIWLSAGIYGVNRFTSAGVVAATLALIVGERASGFHVTLGISTLTGILSAGRTFISMGSAPLAGSISDRIGSRWKTLAWVVGLAAAGMVLMSFSSLWLLMAGIILGAAAGGAIQSLSTALTGDLADTRNRGRCVGLLHTLGDFGSAVGPLFAYALLPALGLPGLYLFCAGVFCLNLLSLALIRGQS